MTLEMLKSDPAQNAIADNLDHADDMKMAILMKRELINSQSLEDTQVRYISQKYTLDKYTLEKYTLAQKSLASWEKAEKSQEKVEKKLRKSWEKVEKSWQPL